MHSSDNLRSRFSEIPDLFKGVREVAKTYDIMNQNLPHAAFQLAFKY